MASANVGPVVPFTYTMSVTNFGPSYTGLVTVTNTLSGNLQAISAVQTQGASSFTANQVLFNLGTLGPGQVAKMTVTAAAAGPPYVAAIDADVASTVFDTNTVNDSAQATVTIIPVSAIVSNVEVFATAHSAFVTGDTAFPALAQLLYGPTPAYGNASTVSAAAVTRHAVMLTGLASGSTYDFNALSWISGFLFSTNGSFTTLTTNAIILNTQDATFNGLWTSGSVAHGTYGTYYQIAATSTGNPTAWARYSPSIPVSGLYTVSIGIRKTAPSPRTCKSSSPRAPTNTTPPSTKHRTAGAG